MTADEVVAIVEAARFRYTSEDDLQAGLAAALTAAGVSVEREVPLSARDRIDLLVDRLGIEVKVTGSWRGVDRQLRRYMESSLLDEVLLVTVKANHLRIEQSERLRVYQLTSGL